MKKTPLRFWVLMLASLSFAGTSFPSAAATITASSCSRDAVNAAISSASNGDTVIIPEGSCTWSSGINMTKQITLRGASAGGVTITHGAGSGTLLSVSTGSSARTTIANLRFMPGTGSGVYIEVRGSGLVPLMHDMYFNLPNFQLQHAVRWFVRGGVIWNTTFESTDYSSNVYGSDSGCLQVKFPGAWEARSTLGTLDTNGDQNLYIEDSKFIYVGQCPDVDDNARVVIRHSQYIGSSGLTHGSTSSEGGRQVEFYDNEFTYPNQKRNLNRYFWWRAGTAVITRNSIQAISGQMWGNKSSFAFTVENARRSGTFGCCTSYPCHHQVGFGGDGSKQVPEPIYIWDNTGNGASRIGLSEGDPANCGTAYSTSDFFKLNRDYFVDAGPKPGYTPYPYPHPLTASIRPLPPSGLQVVQ